MGLKTLKPEVTQYLKEMIAQGNRIPGFMARYVYPKYLETQKKRWATNNIDPDFGGSAWKNPKDQKRKERSFAHYPGAGEQNMVRTGTLYNSIVIPGDSNHAVIFGEHSMSVYTLVDYALYLDEGTSRMEKRSISEFSAMWRQSIMDEWIEYTMGNK